MNTNTTGGTNYLFGIRCERDGTGQLSAAVAWLKEHEMCGLDKKAPLGDRRQGYATFREAAEVAASLNAHAPPCLQYEARAFALGLAKEPKLSEAETMEAIKQWARANKGFADAITKAQAFAQVEQARVDRYVLPIFKAFGFIDSDGKEITHYDNLYLSTDGLKVNEFYARCEDAHQAHGFVGEPGVWPNCQADHLRIKAEHTLIEGFCEFLNLKNRPYGKRRDEMLKTLLKACLAVPATESK